MTPEQAREWWAEAFGDEPYAWLGTPTVLANVRSRGADFARVVRVLEEQMPRPDRDVLDACATRLTEADRG